MKTSAPNWSEAAMYRSERPQPASRLTRAASRLAAFMAALLALVLSGAPAAAASAVGSSLANGASIVEEHLEEREATTDARRCVRASLERPMGAVEVAPRPVIDRGARPAPPHAAIRFIPPQRKTLLRLLH